ncbi:MAG: glutamate 5-kinase, partial [Candidatus Theseobacter exili]|nr:glutamate 5-kinase [Candidatus Theseobacter exili]
MDRRSLMKDVKILVIKVGTRVLATDAGTLDEERISALVREIAQICNNGIKVVLVSSGAITAGIGIIGLKNKPKTLPDKQAAAAVGQSRLMEVYNRVFDESGMISAQILLTAEDLNERRRHLNARNTLVTLLSHGIVPVVNENDTVSVDEIRFGENDRLSALVAQLIQADLLLILSDVDGLMSADPTHGGESMLISCVESVDDSIRSMAGDASAHGVGTGGMRTKLEAAQIVTRAGETMVVANGRKDGVITAVLSGKDEGTLFLPKTGRLSGKKRWLAFFARPNGMISIDKGA